MITALRIEPLASHVELLPVLQKWFEEEWPSYYGPNGRGNAQQDLQRYCNPAGLPYGIVAFHNGALCATAALKTDSIASHVQLSPWVGAALVRRDLRGQGIGTQLVLALERQAKTMGFDQIYCGTSNAERLLQRCGWQLSERINHKGQLLGVYAKAL